MSIAPNASRAFSASARQRRSVRAGSWNTNIFCRKTGECSPDDKMKWPVSRAPAARNSSSACSAVRLGLVMSSLSRPPIAAPRQRGFRPRRNREALIRCRSTKPYETKTLGEGVDATAPDGTAVRLLLSLAGGSMAHFELPAGAVSHAVDASNGRGNLVCGRRHGHHLAPSGRASNRIDRARPGDVADHSARNCVSVSRRCRLGSRVRGDHHAALARHGRGCAREGPWTPTVAAGSA